MYEYKAYPVINFFGLKCCHPDVHSIIRAIPFKGGSIIYLGGGIGITADPGQNSYDPPLNDLFETDRNSYDSH